MTSTNSLADYISAQLQAIFGATNVWLIGTQIISTPTLYCLFGFNGKGIGFNDNRKNKNITLQIDIYYTSSNQNTSTMLNAADSVEELYNEQSYTSTNFYFDGVLFGRNDNIETLDNNIKHSQLLFELRYNEY